MSEQLRLRETKGRRNPSNILMNDDGQTIFHHHLGAKEQDLSGPSRLRREQVRVCASSDPSVVAVQWGWHTRL
jgi:hypothetical protein